MRPSERSITFGDVSLADVRGVLIDLDDTIYRYEPCHFEALRAAFEMDDLGLSENVYLSKYRACRTAVTERLIDQGSCRSRLFAFQLMCEELRIKKPYERAFVLDMVYWEKFLSVMKPDPSAVNFLQRCKERNIPVCVVTDMTAHVQIRKIDRLGIAGFVDQLVTSEEVGIEKPDARMFDLALHKLGVGPTDSIMLGDSFQKDVVGALTLGIRGYLIDLNGRTTL